MKTRTLVMMALFVALNVVLTGVLKIMPSTLTRISATFIVYALCGAMYGPLISGVVAVIGDLVTFALFPSGPYFIGFTISAALSGFAFGFLKSKPGDVKRILIIVLGLGLFVEAGLNTLWLTRMYNMPFEAALIQRSVSLLINTAMRIVVLIPLMHRFEKQGLN